MPRPPEAEILNAARTVALRRFNPPKNQQSHLLRDRYALSVLEEEAREEEAWFRAQMYQGKQVQFLDRLEGEEPEDFRKRRNKETRNVTALLVDMKGMLYRQPPRRKVAPASEDDASEATATLEAISAALDAIWTDHDLAINEVLKLADRMAYLQGLVALRPWYDKAADRMHVRFYPKHRIRIVENPDDPRDPLAIIFRWDALNPINGKPYTRAQIWTDESFQEHDVNGWAAPEAHPYKRKPVVVVWNEYSPETFWTDGRGGGICEANTIINNHLTDWNHTAEFQSFAVPVVKGSAPGAAEKIGPGQPMHFVGKNASDGLTFVSPDWKTSEQIAFLREKIDGVLEVERIPKSAIRLEKSATSGLEVIAQNIPLDEYREERREVFVPVERKLASLMLQQLHEHRDGFNVDPEGVGWQLHVDYAEPVRPADKQQQIAWETHELERGLIHPWQLWMRHDPDRFASEDEAKEAWIAHLQDKVDVEASAPADELRALDLAADPAFAASAGGAAPSPPEPPTPPEPEPDADELDELDDEE